jgi:uncharacterized protein YcgI (DUF1989 family)
MKTSARSSTPNFLPCKEAAMTLITSNRRPEDAVYRHVIPAGEPWLFEVQKGQTLRLLDLEGNQAIDTLFYNADNPRERYDPQRTLRRQGNAYLTTGSVLYSNLGNPLLTIVADTCGRHDTLGGACAQESNTVRYAWINAICTAAGIISLRLPARWPPA